MPNQNFFASDPPKMWTSQMFYIGATVNLNGFLFHLTDADEFTLNYMESHESQYRMADISSIMSKVKGAVEPKYKEFIAKFLGEMSLPESNSSSKPILICYDTTALALREVLGRKITEHEILTFLRYFDAERGLNDTQTCDRSTVQSLVQMALANDLWEEFQAIKDLIYDMDPKNHNGYMKPSKLRTIIKGCRLPIKDIVIDDMFSV